MTQSAADRAGGASRPAVRWASLPEDERRRRQSQSDAARAQATRWAGLSEEERRQRQSQSDAARAEARRVGVQGADASRAETVDLETDEMLQAMWNTIEFGGYDFMSKGDW